MRVSALILLFVALAGGGAVAQNERAAREAEGSSPRQEVDDEVVVRGKRLGELRVAVQIAREQAYDIFNQINSSNDFDVRCRDETRVFSHAKVRVCRPRFETRIEADGAKEYLLSLFMHCPGDEGVTQGCVFSSIGQSAAGQAQAIEGSIPRKRADLNQEIVRLANENAEFGQAILDFYEASQAYEAARRRDDD